MTIPHHELGGSTPSLESAVRVLSALIALCLSACAPEGDAPPDTTAAKQAAADTHTACDARIVFDAGSTSTRGYLYRIGENVNGVPGGIVETTRIKQKPGLSDFGTDPEGAAATIRTILQDGDGESPGLLSQLPGPCEGRVTVDVLATGGMRSLRREEGPIVTDPILDAVRTTLEDLGQDVGRVEIIEGTDEGLYLWLTVNHALGQLDGMPTAGVVEVGGASTQIAFAAPGGVPVSFAGQVTEVYTQSYLGYGQDQAREDWAISECFPLGYEGGLGDYASCRAFMEWVLTPEYCEASNCGLPDPSDFMGVPQPPIPSAMPFYAASALLYTASYLELGETPTTADFARAGAAHCATPWEELEAADPDTPAEYLSAYCFASAWLPSVIERFGFGRTDASITYAFDIAGSAPEWTAGAAICAVADCR